MMNKQSRFTERDFIPYETSSFTGRRVLVLAPHPDDETFGCGGSLALHARAGDPVTVVILTDGGAGGGGVSTDRQHTAARRRRETEAAASRLGVSDISFWDLPDRALADHGETVDRIADLIREKSPQLIYAPSPLEFHPDHRAAAGHLEEAVKKLTLDFDIAFCEINQPIAVNRLVDITSVMEVKRSAMGAYESQLSILPYDEVIEGLSRFRSLTLPPAVHYAEGFFVVSAADIRKSDRISVFIRHVHRYGEEAAGNGDGSSEKTEEPVEVETKDVHAGAADFPPGGDSEFRDPAEPVKTTPASIAAGISEVKESPPVSVIVPTADRPVLLRRALESVCAQTYTRYEIVVVNDGGCDIGDITGALPAETRIRTIIHETARGVSAARNAGLAAAGGRWIAYLDDDDLYDANHLEVLVAAAVENPETRVVYTGCRQRLERWINDRYETIDERLAYNLPFDSQRLLVRNYIATLCMMHRCDLIEATGGFDESLTSHEDWDLWIRFSRKVDFMHVDAVTAVFTRREVPDSYSTGDPAAFLESLKTVRERYAHLITDPAARLDLQQARRVWNLRSAARGNTSLDNEKNAVRQTASDALAVIQEKDRTIFHLESETRRKTRHVELLSADRIEKNVHIETLAGDLDRLRRQRNNLETERLENVGKIEALSAHAANLEADRTVKTRHIENLESMRAEQEHYGKSLEREISLLKTHISQLESQLERTHASFSWRITKPLRYMKKLLRGAAGK